MYLVVNESIILTKKKMNFGNIKAKTFLKRNLYKISAYISDASFNTNQCTIWYESYVMKCKNY